MGQNEAKTPREGELQGGLKLSGARELPWDLGITDLHS